MRDLPRKLTVEELAELFEGRTQLVERLAEIEDPLDRARRRPRGTQSTRTRSRRLNAHPAIGQRKGLSARSASEQGTDADPAVLAELAYLNQVYEEKFGFRFVVFVDGRPKQEILEVLRGRIGRTEDEELDTGCRELIAIARDRWTRT